MRKFAVVLAVLAGCTGMALADPTGPAYRVDVGFIPGHAWQYGLGGLFGGAFQVTPRTGGADWSKIGYTAGQPFNTFCTESMVYNFGPWATIDDRVYYDGVQGYRDLSANLKDVFAIYATQGLAGFSGISGWSTFGDTTQNLLIQAYIWNDLYGTMPNSAWTGFYRAYLDPAYTGGRHLQTQLDALTSQYGQYVYALNLWSSQTVFDRSTDKQSQLILVVPAPAAAFGGVVGLALVGWLKRRLS